MSLVMNKPLTVGLIVLISLSLFGCLRITSQNTNTEAEKCSEAIAEVEQQLQTVHQTKIELSQMNDNNASITPFEDRPNQYEFGLRGDVLQSPETLNSLATQIIDNCDSVSSVSFGAWQSDMIQIYGLIPDGKVSMFECPLPPGSSPPSPEDEQYTELVWGEHCSL